MLPEVAFFNGDLDGDGPSTDVGGFDEKSTTPTFDPEINAMFANAYVKPAGFDDCNYMPNPGYDPDVTFIYLSPTGTMAGGRARPIIHTKLLRAHELARKDAVPRHI